MRPVARFEQGHRLPLSLPPRGIFAAQREKSWRPLWKTLRGNASVIGLSEIPIKSAPSRVG